MRNRRSRHGGGRNHAAKGGAAAVLLPPASESLLYWFDTTDLSVLWKDAAGTDPLLGNHEELCQRIDNKGSSSEFLTEVTEDERPQWNQITGCLDFLGPGITLNELDTSPGSTAPISVAFLGYDIAAFQNTSIICGFWGGFSEIGLRNNQGAGASSSWEIHAGAAVSINFPENMPDATDELWSMIGWGNADPAQKAWSSGDATAKTATATAAFPADNRQFNYGSNGSAGSNGINGRLREILVWNNYQLSDAEVELVKAYDTAKHGTVWAA